MTDLERVDKLITHFSLSLENKEKALVFWKEMEDVPMCSVVIENCEKEVKEIQDTINNLKSIKKKLLAWDVVKDDFKPYNQNIKDKITKKFYSNINIYTDEKFNTIKEALEDENNN